MTSRLETTSNRSALPGSPAAGEALGQALPVEAVLLRGEEQREPAVGDLGGEGDVLRALGGEEDRDLRAQRVDRRLERLAEPGAARQRQVVELAVVLERFLAGDDPADDVDVLARAGQRARVGLAVPALDDLRTGCAEAEDDPTARQVVEGDRRHRRGRRRTRRQLDDAGAEAEPFRVRAPPGQGRQGVGPVGLGGPHRVEPEPLGLLDALERPGRRTGRPVARPVPERDATIHGRRR